MKSGYEQGLEGNGWIEGGGDDVGFDADVVCTEYGED